MKNLCYHISDKKINCHFDESFEKILNFAKAEEIVIITDDVVNSIYSDLFAPFKSIVFPAGEKNKQQSTVDNIINRFKIGRAHV